MSLPESFLLTASSLANAKFMLGGLVVHEQRMRENLDLTHGLIVAEAVMMAAAPKLGRQHAHDVVYNACRRAIEGGGQLADILAEVPEVVDALGSVDAIRRHCDPVNYLGLSASMVDRVLAGG
jgi:3-carboxy-cis,cis-muconate cycloisomerase